MADPNEYCIIYLLTNKVNGKLYVGQSWYDLHIRMGKYGENYKNSIYVYNAIQKHGVENFEYTILEKCFNQTTADEQERYYMDDVYHTRDPEIGYNIKEGGSNGRMAEETKTKISNTLLAKEWSPEALQAKSDAGKLRKGQSWGEHTEEWKADNSVRMINRHATMGHPMQGKEQTEEARIAIGDGQRGKKRDPKIVAQGAAKRSIAATKEQAIISGYTAARDRAEEFGEELNPDALAKSLDTNTTTMYRKLKKNGIRLFNKAISAGKTGKPQNKPIIIKPPIQTVIPGLTRDEVIIKTYQSKMYSTKEMEGAFTIAGTTIYQILKRYNIPLHQ